MLRRLLAPLILVSLLALVVPSAQAAKAPRSFFGVVVDGPALGDDGSLGREAKRIRRSGTG